jgi:uncharacterized iron-regulated membrane protein
MLLKSLREHKGKFLLLAGIILMWLLLAGFSYLLAASFSDWLRQDLQKVAGAKQGHLHEPSYSPRAA